MIGKCKQHDSFYRDWQNLQYLLNFRIQSYASVHLIYEIFRTLEFKCRTSK
jgi:hypothetical protein